MDTKNRLSLVLGLSLILGGMLTISAKPVNRSSEQMRTPSKTANVVRLATYNIGVFDKHDQSDYQLVSDMMREIEADVVCLNELDSCATRTHHVFQLERVADLMGGWDFCYGAAMPFQDGSYGVGVMTRERAIRKFVVPLPQAGGAEPRVLVVVELPNFVIATTHLDYSSSETQIQQMRMITQFMYRYYGASEKPVFLGGDLNAPPDSETLSELKQAWLVLSGTDIGTYPSDCPTTCIDYFLQLDNGVTCDVVATRVLDHFMSGDVRKASDHLPIMLDIRIAP